MRCLLLPVYAGQMAVDHDSPVPLYRQVAAELRRRIADEGLTRLPSLVTIHPAGVPGVTADRRGCGEAAH
jgi:hypothetical protein